MDIAKVIHYNLVRDVTDRDPEILVSSYPAVFSASGQVPEYLYKSLGTLWLGTTSASADLDKKVSVGTGGSESSSGSIVILVDSTIPSYISSRGQRNNDPGAVTSIVRIVLYKPPGRTTSPDQQISNTADRIVYILDEPMRQLRHNPQLTLAGSNNIGSTEDDFIMCYLEEIRGPGNVVQEKASLELIFRVEYMKIFLA